MGLSTSLFPNRDKGLANSLRQFLTFAKKMLLPPPRFVLVVLCGVSLNKEALPDSIAFKPPLPSNSLFLLLRNPNPLKQFRLPLLYFKKDFLCKIVPLSRTFYARVSGF